ncbi:MAG TPA: methyltransferase domain-containing protein [Actinomycetota bacterium]|nr:methyltransferase domain-containing protein [Actinomycetota bacterium]HVM35535.1 methyltransferase domain-containing protein [Actinomycetota bacterium]
MTGSVETFQISVDAAEGYEAKFVPALFGEWAPHLVEAAGVTPGRSVLDVACGTGVVARTAADRTAGDGRVVGLDINEGMLSVAQRLRPDIEWQHGDAGELPFPHESFDVVLCQAALMFFPDRAGALREMARVVVPTGTVAVQVWAGLKSQLAYGPFIEAAARHAGPDAIDLLSSYWVLGDLELVDALFDAAGLEVTATRTRTGTARFDSVDDLVRTEVESTPLIDRIDDDVYDAILEDSRAALEAFITADGSVAMPIEGHLITARKGRLHTATG